MLNARPRPPHALSQIPGAGASTIVVFRSIRSKIIVGIVSLLIIMAAALTLVATQRTEAALRAQIEATHEAHAERIAQDLDRRIEDGLAFADAAGRNELFRAPVSDDERSDNGTVPPDGATARRTFLRQIVATVDLYASATLLDADGAVVLAEPYERQRYMVRAANVTTGVSPLVVLVGLARDVGDSYVQRGLEAGTWFAVVPLYAHNDTFHGVLVFEGRNAPLVAFAAEAVDAPGTVLFIIDDQRRVIAGPGPFLTGHDLADESRPLFRPGTRSEILSLDDERYLASAFPLRTTAWHLVLATETDTAFGAVQTILRTTILLGAIALVFGVAMSLVLAHDISTPIRRVRDAALRVTAGEYGTQVRVSTRDELADLAGAFNAMSARLLEENQRLLRYQETLEDTVEERTRALTEKNDELEAFVYAASHDLRTPIISLDWLVQDLEENLKEGGDPALVTATLGRIRANIDGMDQLVGDLLELSRIGRTEGEPEPVPVREVVEHVATSLAAQLRDRGVTLDLDIPTDAVILADRRRMQQVFSNLLNNAIKYGPDQAGHVTVRALPVGSAERPWKWRVEVADNGPGVPVEHRERIFMLFQRAPDPLGRVIEGSGVGLAMVRKIIHAYGGQIHVTDAPGGGALFWFTLPTPRRPATTAPTTEPGLPPLTAGRGPPKTSASGPDEQPLKYDQGPSSPPRGAPRRPHRREPENPT